MQTDERCTSRLIPSSVERKNIEIIVNGAAASWSGRNIKVDGVTLRSW
jgi:hypothetical protein